MINVKSKKGITIVALVVTMIILLILSGVIIMSTDEVNDINKLNNMYADIKLLEEKILIYYNKYGDIPKKNTDLSGYGIIDRIGLERNLDDNDIYYEIDSSKLDSITLNYGEGTDEDIYIINQKTLTVYYLKGIKYDYETHYTCE